MQEKEEDLDSNEGSPGVREKNILVTFAFLVEAFIQQANNSGIRKFGEDEPNCKAIAEHIDKLVLEANHGNKVSGQSATNIRKLIGKAMVTKKKHLQSS
jgi:hypothetical protein